VASRLLESWDGDDLVLHGDLETKNILVCHKRGLAAIDPLACVGDPAYDAAYWAASAFPSGRRDEGCALLAAALGLDPERVRSWASVVAIDPPR
jgi:streptomycin 6-kinase